MPRLQEIFHRIPYKSIKWDSYFPVYEQVLKEFVGQRVTLVEIGVLDGGSLFLWRTLLGPQVRIIGIDANPATKALEEQGFEIFIGDQASEDFWAAFYHTVGPIDILIDDGGHTNRQQIVTLRASLDHVRDNGLMIFEDVHASYMADFGNPCRYNFVKFCQHIVDGINSRNPSVTTRLAGFGTSSIHSVSFFESMICLRIDRPLCIIPQHIASGAEQGLNAIDHRHHDKPFLPGFKATAKRWLRHSFLGEIAARSYYWAARQHLKYSYFRENISLRKYF
jgi:Methyltransferase domain